MKKYIINSFVTALLFSASFAFAQAPSTPNTINDIFNGFAEGNGRGFFPVLTIIALVTFFAGIVKYVAAGDDEEARSNGRQVMIYGLIVLFVMVSTWGFVGILYRTFFSGDPQIPNYLPPLLK